MTIAKRIGALLPATNPAALGLGSQSQEIKIGARLDNGLN